MSAQVVQAFPIDKSVNSWKEELFEFLNLRLDQIAECWLANTPTLFFLELRIPQRFLNIES